jgi:hypothetical protein
MTIAVFELDLDYIIPNSKVNQTTANVPISNFEAVSLKVTFHLS